MREDGNAPARVMLVENDAVVASEVAQRLEALGYEIAGVVGQGDDSTATAAERRADIVLADLPRGAADPVSFALHVRSQWNLPVVFLVGPDELAQLVEANLSESIGAVLKPGDAAALHSSLALTLALHQMQKALHACNARQDEDRTRLAGVESLAHLGSWVQDIASGELQVSAECARIHGLDPRSACPALTTLWSRVHPSDRDGLKTLVQRARDEAQSYETDYRVVLVDGDERVLRHRVRVLTDNDGHPRRLLAMVQDVTAQERAHEALRQSEARASRLLEERDFVLEHSRDVLYYIDQNGVLFYISPAVEQLTGYAPEEWHGDFRTHMADSERNRQAVVETFEILRTGREYPPAILEFQKKDGGIICAEVNERAIVKDGHVLGIVGVARDVTERLHVEARLRQAAAVFENTLEAIIITDSNGHITAVNEAFVNITGYTEAEVRETLPDFVVAGDEPGSFRTDVWNAVRQHGRWTGEVWNRRKSGEAYPAWVAISTSRDEHRKITSFVIVVSDLSHLRASEEKLDRLAHYDPLTRLPNRLLFNSRLAHAIRRAEREQKCVAVMFIDLDHFKNVNDTLGHPSGDRLLQQVGTRLEHCLRKEDTVARLGGDEFVVIVEDVGDSRFLAEVARKVLHCLAEPYTVNGEEAVITASIGISLYPHDGTDVTRLVQNADTAMYRAKELGRANFQFYTAELTVRAVERMRLEIALRAALRREEFVLHYQPQVSLETGDVIGIEALIRWRHPEHGLMLPMSFIPLGEETGLIIAIGDWVLRTACAQVKAWWDAGAVPVVLAVNVSARQFSGEPHLAQRVAAVLKETGLDPGALQLEITETAIMRNAEEAVGIVKELRDIGVSVAIDDFGTGYSSMVYLKRFAVDKLKTDKSFMRQLPFDASDRAITQAIIALSHSLHLKVIAEGVESVEQQQFLREQGCDEMQGFLFSAPLAAQDCMRLLMQRPH